ncbi:hypothetical protein Elgi_46820 [Paenibacillus elgii]|nr:hypothetical protein Elgi_46820 [Paenibacillus elgii]
MAVKPEWDQGHTYAIGGMRLCDSHRFQPVEKPLNGLFLCFRYLFIHRVNIVQNSYEFVCLEELVTQNHLLRKIHKHIDFSFILEK